MNLTNMKKYKSYFIEFTIVTIGVLIALFLNSVKENYQAEEYQKASLKTIKKEVEENYSSLKGVIEKQSKVVDTFKVHVNDDISIYDVIRKTSGIQSPNLSNSGLELYTRNQISSIDLEVMSTLVHMNKLSELIGIKLEKLMDYVYPNIFDNSKESKMMFIMYVQNVLDSENQLLHLYQTFLNKQNKDESK